MIAFHRSKKFLNKTQNFQSFSIEIGLESPEATTYKMLHEPTHPQFPSPGWNCKRAISDGKNDIRYFS